MFDAFTRALAATRSRRAALGALVATTTMALPRDDSAAKREHRKKTHGKKARDKKRNSKRKHNQKHKHQNKHSGKGGCSSHKSEDQILGYITKAAKKYGQSRQAMERVARCESNLDPCAVNKSGPYYGLYQFLKSTWKTTPYGNKSIFDPKAQAMAAGWMWKQGRKNEWACK
jgi:hypothetical protein